MPNILVIYVLLKKHRFSISGLSENIIERIIKGHIFYNSIPGLELESLPQELYFSNSNSWFIKCFFGKPRVVYDEKHRIIEFYYDNELDLESNLLRLVLQLIELSLHKEESLLLLHGSFICSASKGVILIGPPFSGKTTVAVQGILSGWSCKAGERLIFNTQSLKFISGTHIHYLSKDQTDRFFPSLSLDGCLSTHEVMSKSTCPQLLPTDAISMNSASVIVMPKVTDKIASTKLYITELNRDTLFRIINLDIGMYISGNFYLNSLSEVKIPGLSLDSYPKKVERVKRTVQFCENIPAFFVEGHPEDILNWLENINL